MYTHTDTTKNIVSSNKVIKAEINATARILYLSKLAGATQTAHSKFQDEM